MTYDQRLAALRERHRLMLAAPPRAPEATAPTRQRSLAPRCVGRRSPVAVARAYQIRNLAAGKCSKCPRPLVTSNHCDRHAAEHATLQRGGRPPLRVCKCSNCGEAGHQNRTCARRKAVAARSVAGPTMAATNAVIAQQRRGESAGG